MPPSTVLCWKRSCRTKTIIERSVDGLATRVCEKGHKAKYRGRKFEKEVRVNTPRAGSERLCWCGEQTRYMPACAVIVYKSSYIEALKRVCPKGHRSWFRRTQEGGEFIRKVRTSTRKVSK